VVPFPVEQAVYDIQRHPDKAQFLIGGGVTSNWARVERGDDGTWRMVDQWEGGFHWDYAAADFARNRGFIHDGAGRRLRVLQLDPMGEIATVPVPLEQFPTHDVDATFLMHAYNPATRRLFVADLRGSIYRLDTETLTVERTGFVLPHGDRLVAIREDAAAGELLVLYNRALFVLDAVTLEQREAHELPFQAEGMAYDETTRTFYLARPMDMSLAVVPRDTMRIARSIPAPAGVRVVTLDPERGRVFLGAITGVVEIRDLSDGRLVRRARLTSWIHGMAVFGEEGDAVITVGENLPIIWHYGATKPGWDPIDTMLRWTEAAIRWGFGRWGSPIRPPGKMVDRDALVGNETIGLLMPDNGDRAILQAHFRQGGYDVRATDDPARLAEWRSKSREDGGVAVIVADPSLLGIGRGGLSEATLNDAAGAVSFAVASPPTANDCRRRLVRRCLASPFDRFNVLFTVREMITYGTLSGPSDTSAR
ncbi:hypothetical protein KDL45_10950, partial [bacterium]|nr:hypothetical protein [bacterium]